MTKFLVVYYAPAELMAKMKDTPPEEAKKGMEAWHAWAEKCGSALLDLGNPLGNGQKLTPDGSSASDKEVAGYSMLEAESMDAAKALLEGHPHLGWDASCAIEVYEALPLPGME